MLLYKYLGKKSMKKKRSICFNPLVVDKIEKLAKKQERSFSDMLERLAEKGLESFKIEETINR